MKYERLFSPLKIKNLELKNRVIMSAMHHAYTPEGYVTERFKEYPIQDTPLFPPTLKLL